MAIYLVLLSIYCALFCSFLGSVSAADDEDPFDLSFYTKGAAIGDSYTAGIGAGNEENWSCSRYDGSYASLVSLQLGVDRNKLDFTYTACSGAVVDDISKQAKALSSGQEFVIMSAGGNDAKLSDILNSCVYSFYAGFSHPNCEKVLDASRSIIEGDQFAAKSDALIELVKSKLAPNGNIYYAGYAKFFDTTDNTCDNVSWHMWLNLFTKEYLTKDRREKMNSLVEAMNTALSSAVQRAGPQVHFIDYDNDVGVSRGRYCQPGQDENSGRGANLEDLFFYQMKSLDSPWLDVGDAIYHDELKRSLIEEDDVLPTNDTLGGMYGALMQKAIDESANDGQDGYAAVQDDNGNIEIEDEVKDAESSLLRRSVSLLKSGPMRMVNRSENTTISWNATQNLESGFFPSHNVSQGPMIGSKVSLLNANAPSSFLAGHTNMHFANTTALTNGSSMGTVIANRTHVLLGNKAVARINIKKLFVSDETSRVFHPTQGGHALIANMILYQMAADNARRLGIDSIPPMISNTTGDGWPELPGAACNQDATDTWAGRDAMISAVEDFCADPHNTRGSKGDLTSATFGSEFDYMNVSISWESDNDAVISEHGCSTWLDIVTDGCNVPQPGQSNDKHGGLIEYTNTKLNATMKIEPLVMRRIWDGGQAGGQQCNGIDTNNYLDQETLASNIDDFCAKSAGQNVADSDSSFSQIYNDGTPDRVELSTQWPKGERNYEVFKEECLYYMSVINNGCSLPGDDNKMNWKHGGSISDNNNILYKISPTQSRPPPPSAPLGSCKAPLQLPKPHYAVSITGGGFSNSDNGAALRREFKNCGARSALTFNYLDTPAEDGTEWTAYAELPLLITSHCAQRAIRRVGGFVNNQC